MRKHLLILLIGLMAAGIAGGCKSKKVLCPTYGGPSTPIMPKAHKHSSSGVMPSDGHSKRTKLPN